MLLCQLIAGGGSDWLSDSSLELWLVETELGTDRKDPYSLNHVNELGESSEEENEQNIDFF